MNERDESEAQGSFGSLVRWAVLFFVILLLGLGLLAWLAGDVDLGMQYEGFD